MDNKILFSRFKHIPKVKAVVIALFFWILGMSHGYAQFVFGMSASTKDAVTIEAYAESWNDWVFPRDSEIWWFVNDTLIKTVGRRINSGDKWVRNTEIFKIENFTPGSTQKISAYARHENTVGGWHKTNTITQYVTMPAYQPVSNVKATERKFQGRVEVTWDINEIFTNQSYVIYANNVEVGRTAKGVNTFTHAVGDGVERNYTVRGFVNGMLMPAPAGAKGSTFVIGVIGTTNQSSGITLSWNSVSGTHGATGISIERRRTDSNLYTEIYSTNNPNITGYTDAVSGALIPGYTYQYRVRVLPANVSDVMGIVTGKLPPNGTIRGRVTTPPNSTNPSGVGVPNVNIFVRLLGPTLPTDPTSIYTAKTDNDGRYEINNVYYYTEAKFEVRPSLESRIFENLRDTITLKTGDISKTVNFTDLSSFVISGTVVQNVEQGKTCPLPGVRIELFGSVDEYYTDSLGRYDIPVGSGGVYKLTPVLANHVFNPVERNVTVTANTSGVNFTDNTKAIAEGYFLGSCNVYAGVATLRFYTPDNCFSKEVITEDNTGKYSIELPARDYLVEVKEFESKNENIVASGDVLAYFFDPVQIDLTSKDTVQLNLIYRTPPQLRMEGIFSEWTCGTTIDPTLPILVQNSGYTLTLYAIEEFDGKTCPAGPGSIRLYQNITSIGAAFKEDTLYYNYGDTLRLRFEPGTPNRIAPHHKRIEARLFSGDYRDEIIQNVLVTGHVPREQTFTTVTPEIPFHVLHHPPGDQSYSYIEKGQTISNTFTFSHLEENEEGDFRRTQYLPTISVTVAEVVSFELKTQFDLTVTNTGGSSTTTVDEMTITTTATERFSTVANETITGRQGDVIIGGALNMIYGLTDIILWNSDECKIEQSVKIAVAPEKFATTFLYTVHHLEESVIPSLERLRDYYLNLQNDSAIFYTDQINV